MGPALKNRNDFDTALAGRARTFCKTHGIKLGQFWAIVNSVPPGCSRSQAHRILQGTVPREFIERRKRALIAGFQLYLRSCGLTELQQVDELKKLFPEEDFAPMISARVELDDEVLAHFRLTDDPFIGHPSNAKEVFQTRELNRILTKLEDAVHGQQFRAVIGDIGSGKTVLRGRLEDIAARSHGKIKLLWPRFAEMDRVSSGAIVTTVLEALNQKPRQRLVQAQRQLEEVLSAEYGSGNRIAICFDEAHNLAERVFKALKNFHEMGGGFDRFLAVILFGQPPLKTLLDDFRFREISERARVLRMPSVSSVAAAYIGHRLAPVGRKVDDIFEPGALKLLAEQVSTPLAIGNLCSAAMVKAHDAGERKVTTAFVKANFTPQVRAIRKAS